MNYNSISKREVMIEYIKKSDKNPKSAGEMLKDLMEDNWGRYIYHCK